jgi:hypothetical protein
MTTSVTYYLPYTSKFDASKSSVVADPDSLNPDRDLGCAESGSGSRPRFLKKKNRKNVQIKKYFNQKHFTGNSFLKLNHLCLARSISGSTDPSESALSPDPKQCFKQNK